jgi:hypothetical protein
MSLPRPKSVFDAAPLRGAFAAVVAPTGAPKRRAEEMAPAGDNEEGCEITECSDEEFATWIGSQKSVPGKEKWFSDHMLQAWMTLSTAATKAQAAYTDELGKYAKFPKRPEAADYSPYSAFYEAESRAGNDYEYPNGIPEEYLKSLQGDWQEGYDKREAMRKKPLALLARAEQVQPLISKVV